MGVEVVEGDLMEVFGNAPTTRSFSRKVVFRVETNLI